MYNGVLMNKFKHPLPNQNSVIRSLARGHKSDTNNLEYEVHRETDLSFYLGKNQGLPDLGKNQGFYWAQ